MSKLKSLIPNLITAGNLVGGVLAIIFSLTGRLEWAPYCIFISAFLDFFDGFAARLLKVQSEMGKQLDSLADMVTFGVAQGVMVFCWIKAIIALPVLNFDTPMMIQHYGMLNLDVATFDRYMLGREAIMLPPLDSSLVWSYLILPFIALLIPVMSMFRLAKFNLDTRQTDSFIGVPTPANTLFFVSIPLIMIQIVDSDFWSPVVGVLMNPYFYIITVPAMSFLLIAELPLFALKFKTFGWKGNEIRYIFLTLCVVMLATLWWLAVPLIIILYILLSIIQNILKK